MEKKIKIIFVCHGNICRSPMAEFVMKKKANERGFISQVDISSSATSTEEIGNPVYPGARRVMNAHGIDCSGKYAVQLSQQDIASADFILAMDDMNLRNIRRIALYGGHELAQKSDEKTRLLLFFAGREASIADPWYTGNFDQTWQDVNEGCDAFADFLIKEGYVKV